jgi:hypothetical protein
MMANFAMADFAFITIRNDEFTAVLQRFHAESYKVPGGRTYGQGVRP